MIQQSPYKHLLGILFVSAAGPGMVVFCVQVLSPGLPQVADDLGASLSQTQWVLIVFGLVMSALVPICGRLNDIFDRKSIFVAGLVFFTVGSFLGALGISVEFLIFARFVQGIGAASLMATGFAIVIEVFPIERRPAALGVVVGMIGVGVTFALITGGFLITHVGWQATFLTTGALGLVHLAAALLVLPPGLKSERREPIDWLGALMLSACLVAFLLAITKGYEWGWSSATVLGLLIGSGVLLVAFVLVELRIPRPLIDLSLFSDRMLSLNYVATLAGFFPVGGFYILIPYYLQGPRGFTAQETGFMMLPFPLGNMTAAMLTGRFTSRFGSPLLSALGLTLLAIGFCLMALIGEGTSVPDIAWRIYVAGLGIGFYQTANSNIIVDRVPPERRGSASGLVNVGQQVGINTGVGIAGTVLGTIVTRKFPELGSASVTPGHFHRFANDPESLLRLRHAFMAGMEGAFFVVTAGAALGLAFTLLSFVRRRSEEAEPAVSFGELAPSAREDG